jgi:receptor expression-enhancing protein 5/6
MEIIQKQVEKLNQYGKKIKPIVQLSEKTKVEPGYILGGALFLTALTILILFGGTILSAVLTVVYPAFKSIKALETKDTEDDDKVWLTYWVVFGVFTLLDEFAFFILNLIPFYWYIRLGFFVWLMAPQTQGAQIVYKNVLRPLLNQHKDRIQKIIDDVKGGAQDFAKEAKK